MIFFFLYNLYGSDMNLKKLFQGTLLRLSLSLSIYPLFGKKAQPHFLPGGFFLLNFISSS